jgi:hypothetical protein
MDAGVNQTPYSVHTGAEIVPRKPFSDRFKFLSSPYTPSSVEKPQNLCLCATARSRVL